MSAIGPWIRRGAYLVRLSPDGRTCSMIFPPGDADAGRWGWWAGNERGESLPPVGTPKAGDETEAKRLADDAARTLGHTIADGEMAAKGGEHG